MSSQSCSSSTSTVGSHAQHFMWSVYQRKNAYLKKVQFTPPPPPFYYCLLRLRGACNFLGGGVLSHKIHGNTREYLFGPKLLHTVSSCLFTLCNVQRRFFQLKWRHLYFFSYTERNRMTLSADKMMTIK